MSESCFNTKTNVAFYRLVCSDLISRGIDISHVSHVVSYDAPVDMRKYVHRVGRTARAGRTGDAWTLVEEQEVRVLAAILSFSLPFISPSHRLCTQARYFKKMFEAVNRLGKLKKLRVAKTDVASFEPHYQVR